MKNTGLDRRSFVQLLGGAAAGAGLGALPAAATQARAGSAATSRPPANLADTTLKQNVVAIQVKPFCWVDEGIDQVLDNLQQKGNVNTVFTYTYDYDPAQIIKGGIKPLPDHGKYSPRSSWIGGAFYDYDLKYFRDTTLTDFRSRDLPNFNVITAVAPKMKARGMDFFAWDYNNAFPQMMENIPGLTDVAEIDVYGRRTTSACFNHPNFRGHLTGKIESYLVQYPTEVDGIIWGCERMGPIDNMIGGGWATVGICCFCPFCLQKAKDRGISAERARMGYVRLDQLFAATAKHQRPDDGVGTAKALAPHKPFGFHMVQNITFSPFYSAADDYAKVADYSDFLKIATYNNAAGPRLSHFIDRLCATVFADAAPADLQPFYYKMMGYHEASFQEIVTKGLSAAYVTSETKRAIAGTGGRVKIFPGIDIDVPTAAQEKHTKPEDVRAATAAALEAGADGVVLSREYYEMWLENLSAAGETTRKFFVGKGN
jgi:hypothetical protein